jgi:subtilisin family serine protease
LAVNVWTNPGEIPNNRIDDDGNGYVDDVRGWDFANNDNTTYDNGDDHGTHVAGTIGATGGNGVGVAGVNWNITMIPAKFLGRNGGTTANAIKAIDYLIDLKARYGLNLVATNNSWGGGGFSQGLLDAINRSGNAGILFIAAAGNGGSDGVGDDNDAVANYPSNYVCSSSNGDCLIAVAAITSSGAKASFSNYGKNNVDLGAPGVAILSTVPGRRNSSDYASYSGTSMATPHVTGAAALYASTHPGASAADIKAAILNAAIPTPSLAGRTVTGGRLNVSGF